MDKLNNRIEKSVTHTVKAIFPNTTNHYDTLFGGTALMWMDEIAFITATRFSRQRMVKVEVYIEQMYSDEREKAMEGTFTMVAINEEKQPVKIVI